MPDRHPGPYRFRGNIAPSADVARPVAAYRHAARNETTTSSGSGSGTAATLDILDVIDGMGGWWGIAARDVARALTDIGPVDTLYVRIQSPGGEAQEGVAIANLLRANPATVRTTVYGMAASAASYIAIAGDKVSMAPGSQMFLHDALTITFGNADELRKDVAALDSLSDSIASLYALKAGGDAEEWRAVMRDEKWYTADEAVTVGLADAVGIDLASGPVETPGGDGLGELDGAFASAAARFDLSVFAHPPAVQASTDLQDPESSTDPEEDGSMPDTIPTAGVCRALGLPSDADEDTILDALDKNVKAAAEKPPADASKEQAAAFLTALKDDGKVVVSQAYLDTLKEGVEDGRAALARQRAEDRDKAIAKAQDDGKIGRSEATVKSWRAAWDRDPDGTAKEIADLGVRFPVANATGYAGSDTSDGAGTKPFTDEEGDALAALAGLPAGVLR